MNLHLLGFGALFLLGGLFAVISGIERHRQRKALMLRAVKIKARIVSVRTEDLGESSTVEVTYPTVQIIVNGKKFDSTAQVGRLDADLVRIGTHVTVYYDPRDPTKCVLAPTEWQGGGCLTLLGVIAAMIGGGLLLAWWTENHK